MHMPAVQVHSALGDLDAAFRMLIAGSRTQASSNDAAAMEFLQPPHIELEALSQNKPKGSPEAAAQVGQGLADLVMLPFDCCIMQV
jgi:hypothetical protein